MIEKVYGELEGMCKEIKEDKGIELIGNEMTCKLIWSKDSP